VITGLVTKLAPHWPSLPLGRCVAEEENGAFRMVRRV
jgi:hypothetical protein